MQYSVEWWSLSNTCIYFIPDRDKQLILDTENRRNESRYLSCGLVLYARYLSRHSEAKVPARITTDPHVVVNFENTRLSARTD